MLFLFASVKYFLFTSTEQAAVKSAFCCIPF